MKARLKRLDKLRRFGLLGARIEARDVNTPLGGLRRLQDVLLGLVRSYHGKLAAVYDDGRLTDAGKREKAKTIVAEALAELHSCEEKLTRRAKQRARDLERAFAKLSAPPSDAGEAARAETRAREIRAALLRESSLDRWRILRESVESGDDETLNAAVNAPRILRDKLGDQRALGALRLAWFRKHDAGAADELARIQTALSAAAWDTDEVHGALAANLDPASTRERVTGETRRKAVEREAAGDLAGAEEARAAAAAGVAAEK